MSNLHSPWNPVKTSPCELTTREHQFDECLYQLLISKKIKKVRSLYFTSKTVYKIKFCLIKKFVI